MAIDSPKDAAWVRATIAPQLPEASAGAWVVEGPVFENRNGRLFKATRTATPYPLAIKVHHPATTQADAMARHYTNLEHYFQAMPPATGLTVPKPVLLDAENCTMVMQWIEAPLMSKTLLAAGMNAAARRRQYKIAGRWLAAFHAHAKPEPKPFDSAHHLATAIRIADEIPGDGRDGWAGRYLKTCLEILGRFKTEFDGTSLVYGRRHGDFTPTNIFANDDAAVGIDFLPIMTGPLVTDICRFMAYADIYKYGWTLPHQMDHLAGSAQDLVAFMAGYGKTKVIPSDRMMTYLQLTEITRRIAARTKAVAQHGRTTWRMIELHRLTRRSEYLIKRFET